jgi:hypothetical protein
MNDESDHRVLAGSTEAYDILVYQVPLQAASASAAAKTAAVAAAAESVMSSSFWLLFAIQMVASSALSLIWPVFNTLQLIGALEELKVKLSQQVIAVFDQFKAIVNMELLPKDEIKAWLLGAPEDTGDFSLTEGEGEPQKQEGLLDNMFILVVLLCLCTFLIMLVLVIRLFYFKRLPKTLQGIFLSIQGKLMFNSVLRSTIQSYLKMSIATSAALNAANSLLTSIGFTIWLFSYPVISYKVLHKMSSSLATPATRQKIGSLYTNVDYHNPRALTWTSVFLVRRLIFALTVT